LIRAIEGRAQGYGRARRGGAATTAGTAPASPEVQQLKLDPDPLELIGSITSDQADMASFRERLNTVELR